MLIGTILAKYMIFQIFHIPILEQIIVYGTHGKPFLQNNLNIHFNISYSGQFVLYTLFDKSVGIDIQEIFPYYADIVQRICNGSEFKRIEESSDAAVELIKIWVKKET